MGTSRPLPHWIFLILLLAVLFVATGLRLYQLPERPLGLHYDEAANGILAGEIARDLKRPVFIASYTGKEVLFFYWAALWMKIVGISPLALRAAAASIGVATVGATVWAVYELVRHRSDARWTALIAAAGLAVSFWHLVLSRYGFRAVTQPLLQALTVAALWRGLRPARREDAALVQAGWIALGGLFFGLTAYTYLAARAFPLPIAAALTTLVLVDSGRRRERLGQSVLFVAVAALVLAPLAHYWLTHPGSFVTRARQVAADNWTEVQQGLVACLRMFFLEGDPYIRFNVPGRPLFGPTLAALFLVGLGVAIWGSVRLLRPPAGQGRALPLASSVFLLVFLPVMLLPSALATDEITPSNLRTAGLLPFVYVFPALGLSFLQDLLHRLSARQIQNGADYLLPTACLLLLGTGAVRVAPVYLTWASSPALYYAADGDLADAAEYLNQADFSSVIPYVASRHYRHPTVAFLAEDYEAVRWLAGGRTLVFPSDERAVLIFPRSASEDLGWVRATLPEGALVAAPAGPDGAAAFHVYRSEIAEAPTPVEPRSINLGGVTRFLGYTITNQPRSGESVDIALWWRVTGPPEQGDFRPVARLGDRWGAIWGTRQPLHYPSEQWKDGELIVDHLSIPIAPGAPPGDYVVRFGFYAPSADIRLPVLDDSGAYAGLYVDLPVHVARAATAPPISRLDISNRLDAAARDLTLLGASLERTTVRPGEPLRATLFWQAGESAPPPYELSLRLGETLLYRGDPVHDTYPFDRWEPGEVVVDRYAPRLPLDVAAGQYPLSLQIGDVRALQIGQITVEETERSFEAPNIEHSVGATLSHRVELLGYDLSSDSVAPGETVKLTLIWRALAEMMSDYTVFTHLLAPDGSMVGQQDQQPVGGSYPTSIWAPGEVVTDVYDIPVDPSAAPGEHHLEVGMYIAETGTRLSIEGDADNAVTLQTISVTE